MAPELVEMPDIFKTIILSKVKEMSDNGQGKKLIGSILNMTPPQGPMNIDNG